MRMLGARATHGERRGSLEAKSFARHHAGTTRRKVSEGGEPKGSPVASRANG
jgi:hypothetical protein